MCYCCTDAEVLPTHEADVQSQLVSKQLKHRRLDFEYLEWEENDSYTERFNPEPLPAKGFNEKKEENSQKTINIHSPALNVDGTSIDSTPNFGHPDVSNNNRMIHYEGDADNDVIWTKAQQWGYAFLANSFNVCLALSGIMIVKCSNGGNRRVLGDFFLGLAVSIMLGDSLLHIMPEILDLKSEFNGNTDDVQEESEYYLVIAKMGTILGTVYLFWFLQSLMKLIGCGHSHDHGTDACSREVSRKVSETINATNTISDTHNEPEVGDVGWTDVEGPKWSIISGMVFGDSCCNFSDGLAIGVSWTLSWTAGLGTTLAIVLHKLPNELGDFIVYKKLGLSTRMAVGLNLFAAMISFVGLFIGLALATETDAEEWLLALVAGLFIFIPIFNIMPQMKLEKDTEDNFLRFVVQNLGMTTGFTIMVILAIFEDDITNV